MENECRCYASSQVRLSPSSPSVTRVKHRELQLLSERDKSQVSSQRRKKGHEGNRRAKMQGFPGGRGTASAFTSTGPLS